MEFGIYLPSAGPTAEAAGLRDLARAAEELGWDSLWMPDHLFTPRHLKSPYPYTPTGDYYLTPELPFYDVLGLYGVLGALTEKVKIGAGVMVAPYRHPLVVAKALATIEQFAAGRIVLGLGAGWMREEFDAVGVSYERRGARLTDYIGALRAAWSGEATGYEGEFYRWPEAGLLPAPTSPIPIILGGHSDAAIKRAARHADGWAVITPGAQGGILELVKERISLMHHCLDEAGRNKADFQLVFQTPLWISDRPNPKHPLTGPPEAIADAISSLESLGINTLACIVAGDAGLIKDVVSRFNEEVRPLL